MIPRSASIGARNFLLKGSRAGFWRTCRTFASAHPNNRILAAYAGKVNAVRVKWCALKRRIAEENSDCIEQGEDNGVSLKSYNFAADSSARN